MRLSQKQCVKVWICCDGHRSTKSRLAIHITADIIGEADPLSSMTALRAAAEGGRGAVVDKSGSLATLTAKR
jgi:hypothetical protein